MSRLAVLEGFARAPRTLLADAGDRCGLCGHPVEPGHAHVLDVETRALPCACRACHLLLSHPQAVRGRYRALPRRVLSDPGFRISDAQWARLQIPVGLAFISLSSGEEGGPRWVVNYPGVAGAIEGSLPSEAWAEVAAASLVQALAPEVEALLVFGRPGVPGRETFLVPIDSCYALVGLVRSGWRGFSGGAALWSAVDAFFADLRGRARPLAEPGEAA
jgi:hypothetical protein